MIIIGQTCLKDLGKGPPSFREQTQIKLVVQEALFKTDLSKNYDRLSMPFSQIITWGFFREDEKEWFRKKHSIEVPIMTTI